MTRITLGLIALFALIAAACVAFGAYFSYVTLLNAHGEAIRARFALTAGQVASTAELASSLGIALPAQSTLSAYLAREGSGARDIRSIDVADEKGAILFSSDPARVGRATAPDPAGGAVRSVERPILNDLGEAIGRVRVRYDAAVLAAGARALREDLLPVAVPAAGGAFLATIAIGLLLAAGLRRAARDAATPARWPAAARSALAAVEEAHGRLAATPPASREGGR